MQNIKIKSFKDLIVWQKCHSLVIEIYKITKNFPKNELFSLTNQIQRSAVSITSNISEGFGRYSKKDKIHFFIIARGSINELHNQLLICKDIKYINDEEFEKLETNLISCHQLLQGLIRKSRDFFN